MLKLGEGEIIGEIPVHKHKIIKAEIISNPFDNMVARPRAKPQIIDEEDKKNQKKLYLLKQSKIMVYYHSEMKLKKMKKK